MTTPALTAAVVVLALLTVVLVVLLWRATRLIHELEHILADTDDRVRSLELQLLHHRRIT